MRFLLLLLLPLLALHSCTVLPQKFPIVLTESLLPLALVKYKNLLILSHSKKCEKSSIFLKILQTSNFDKIRNIKTILATINVKEGEAGVARAYINGIEIKKGRSGWGTHNGVDGVMHNLEKVFSKEKKDKKASKWEDIDKFPCMVSFA